MDTTEQRSPRRTKKLAETLRTFGWPPIMRMEIAARYACTSKRTITRAVNAGQLRAAGRQGRSRTFLREDLDRWMLGPAEESQRPTEALPMRSSSPISKDTADALDRLRAIRSGAR